MATKAEKLKIKAKQSFDADMKKREKFDYSPSSAKILMIDIINNSLLKRDQTGDVWGNGLINKNDGNFIKSLIRQKIKDNPSMKYSGTIKYDDYPQGESNVYRKGGGLKRLTDVFRNPEDNVQKTFGVFNYTIDKKTGKVNIVDRFNFNDAKKDRQSLPLVEKLRTIKADIKHEGINLIEDAYGAVRKSAQHLSSSEGQGPIINITFDNLEDK